MDKVINLFTGMGGTAKLGIIGIACIAIVQTLVEAGYEAESTTLKGTLLKMKPTKRVYEAGEDKQIVVMPKSIGMVATE